MKHAFEIPPIMRELEIDERGYPIPYFVPIIEGKPNFVYQDHKKRTTCLEYSKCAVCSKPLYAKSFWFIGGPMGLQNRISSDAPMHEDCARFSLTACPHLQYFKAERRSEGDGDPNKILSKPSIIHLIKASKISVIFNNGHEYITFKPVLVESFNYVNNRLTKISTN